jgi:MerR family transcriptional regulator/heat shock protein HspR
MPIAEVARRTGIAVTTLRFYEKELPGLFRPRKTAGGHRRYAEQDVARFAAIRRLTGEEGLGLGEVRRVMASRGDAEPLREGFEALSRTVERCELALADLASRVERLEARVAEFPAGKRRRWFQ